MKKILVTGATGCVGINLVEKLSLLGHHVTATGLGKPDALIANNNNVVFVEAQLQDTATIINLCEQQDIVIHCGALSSPWGKFEDFFQANVIGTKNIIAGCLTHHVSRLVYISTPSLYFNFSNRLAIKESDPLASNPVNAYAQTKLLAEQAITDAYQKHNLPVITLRPRALFGPYDTALVPRILRAVQQGILPLINGGNALVDVTYVDNLVSAIVCSMHADHTYDGSIYNITNGQPMPLHLLLEKILTALGYKNRYTIRNIPYWVAYALATAMEYYARTGISKREPTLTRYGVGVFAYSQTLDISKARQELGYCPSISIDEGIQRYAHWLNNR